MAPTVGTSPVQTVEEVSESARCEDNRDQPMTPTAQPSPARSEEEEAALAGPSIALTRRTGYSDLGFYDNFSRTDLRPGVDRVDLGENAPGDYSDNEVNHFETDCAKAFQGTLVLTDDDQEIGSAHV